MRRARYLDPKTSRWLSADPALGEYIPLAPVNNEAKKHNQNLPGMGGIYNTVNFHLYHYAGNNPVKYTDPTGMFSYDTENGVIICDLNDPADIKVAGGVFMADDDVNSVIATDGETSMTFNTPKEVFDYYENTKLPMSQTEKNRWIGVGAMLSGVAIIYFSVKEIEKQSPESKNSGPAFGFKIGVDLAVLGFVQMITGDVIIPNNNPLELLKDPKVDAIQVINDNLKKLFK